MTTVFDLPPELLLHVLSYLTRRDIRAFAAACPAWQHITEEALRLRQLQIKKATQRWEICTHMTLRRIVSCDELADYFDVSMDKLCVLNCHGCPSLWDTQLGTQLQLEYCPSFIWCVALSTDSQYLATGGRDETVRVLDTKTGNEVHKLMGHTNQVHSVAWTTDDQRIASGSSDSTVCIWDVKKGQQVLKLSGHTRPVHCVVWSTDGHRLASSSCDGIVCVWDAQTGAQLLQFKCHGWLNNGASLVWSASGHLIAGCVPDKTVRVWHSESGAMLHTLLHRSNVRSISFAPYGDMLVTIAHHNVSLWNAMHGTRVWAIPTCSLSLRAIMRVKFSADGRFLVCGDVYDGIGFFTC